MDLKFRKKPALSKLGVEVPDDGFELNLTSEPFPVRGCKRIAARVVGIHRNESTVLRDMW